MKLEPGDIFATKGKGITGWAVRNLITPPTDRFHFGVVWRQMGNDYITLESVSKGIAVGLLSWYDPADLELYRVDCFKYLRTFAPDHLVIWGRSRYDYLLILKIAFGGLLAFLKVLIKEKRVRRLRAEDFHYGENSSLICTEAVDIAYDAVGVNLIPEGVIPLPSAFRQAEKEGRMHRIKFTDIDV